MSFIAIIGAGPIGGAVAHKLAARGRVRQIRLIDSAGSIAQGKALDILQSGPVENFNASVTWLRIRFTPPLEHRWWCWRIRRLATASIRVTRHWRSVRRLQGAGVDAPLVFAGASQREAMKRTIGELHVAAATRDRGGAAGARVGAARSLRRDCRYVRGRGVAVGRRRAAETRGDRVGRSHRLRPAAHARSLARTRSPRLSARVTGLWPPGPYALGSATARIVEALCDGSRRRYSCFVETGRGRVVAMPVELGPGGVRRIIEPRADAALERTALRATRMARAGCHVVNLARVRGA